MSIIKLSGSNVVGLTTWFKRFASINNSLLFEIDPWERTFVGKTYSEDRSIVKFSSFHFRTLGLQDQKSEKKERVQVAVYNIGKLNKILGQFAGSDFDLEIYYDSMIGEDKVSKLVATKILVKNPSLKVGLDCSSPTIFQYISDEKFLDQIAKISDPDRIIFDLKKEDIDQINVLGDLDKEYKKVTFRAKSKKISARGKSFELDLGLTEKKDFEFPVLKSQFSKLDQENYRIELGESRSVFTSLDSEETITVLGVLNMDSHDSDKEMDLT